MAGPSFYVFEIFSDPEDFPEAIPRSGMLHGYSLFVFSEALSDGGRDPRLRFLLLGPRFWSIKFIKKV